MRKIVSFIFIIIGIGFIAYPKISESYYNYQQEKLIQDWKISMSNIEDNKEELKKNGEKFLLNKEKLETKNNSVDMEALSSQKLSLETLELKEKVIQEELEKKRLEKARREARRKKREEYIKRNMEGMLKIDKINLYLPILNRATKNNLNISVASIENTGKAGEVGNYAIAGHRSHTYGRNFNRLGEIEKGDIIEVDNGNNKYKYIIVDKFLVKPDEVWVLKGNNKDKEITLITCEPMINPTHRLILKGKISEH